MADSPFTVSFRMDGDIAILDMHGEIDSFADDALASVYREVEALQPRAIGLNFNDVHYINSTGIALIVRLLAQARKSGQRVLTYGLSPHYLEIFEVTRLADFMTIVPDEMSALAA